MSFNVMKIIYYIAVILLFTKLLGIGTRKLGLPQVVGMLIAGLLIGPAIYNALHLPFHGLMQPSEIEMDVLQSFSQIGVIFILFSSGLETDFKELRSSGKTATVVALFGVLVPFILGTLLTVLFMGGLDALNDQAKLLNGLFIGCILTATSVGITVETLRELGKLNTRVGTTILSAAIIDDVIGILVLSLVTGFNGHGNIAVTLLKALGFFVFTIGVGYLLRLLFKYLVSKYPHKRRTGIFALSMCFIFAYCAEEFFGIAAITGAYMAGLMLSGLTDTSFVDRKVIVSGYMIFTPIFFAFIGISADFSGFRMQDLIFVFLFILLGICGKIFGCGGAARMFGYSSRDSLSIGCGMIARGEVALAVYSTGKSLIASSGGIDPLVSTIFLIIFSSILCPILLKLTFRNQQAAPVVRTEDPNVHIMSEAIENRDHRSEVTHIR